jgi:hypothetical protein
MHDWLKEHDDNFPKVSLKQSSTLSCGCVKSITYPK